MDAAGGFFEFSEPRPLREYRFADGHVSVSVAVGGFFKLEQDGKAIVLTLEEVQALQALLPYPASEGGR